MRLMPYMHNVILWLCYFNRLYIIALYCITALQQPALIIGYILFMLTSQIGIFYGIHPEKIADQIKYHQIKFGAFITK